MYNNQGIVGFVYNTITYMFRKNLFGDITAIYRGNTKVAEYRYDAWGNCLVIDPTTGLATDDFEFIGHQNPFRYRGYYWDNDLQLYYLMSRYYDPQTGRFINADSLDYLNPKTIGGLNLYSYTPNFSYLAATVTFISQTINSLSSFNTNEILSVLKKDSKHLLDKNSLTLPQIAEGHVVITSDTVFKLFRNKIAGFMLGNFSITQSHNWDNADGFYSFSIIGDNNVKKGFGFNYENMIGGTVYASNDWRVGFTTQAGPFTFGSEISAFEGIGVSIGATDGSDATEVTLNISWPELGVCMALASVPGLSTKIAAGILALIFIVF